MDLSTLSDEELEQIAAGAQPDLSSLSDAELESAAGGSTVAASTVDPRLRDNEGYGPGAQIMDGVTLGTADNVIAGAMTPVELLMGYVRGDDEGKGFMQRVNDAYQRT